MGQSFARPKETGLVTAQKVPVECGVVCRGSTPCVCVVRVCVLHPYVCCTPTTCACVAPLTFCACVRPTFSVRYLCARV